MVFFLRKSHFPLLWFFFRVSFSYRRHEALTIHEQMNTHHRLVALLLLSVHGDGDEVGDANGDGDGDGYMDVCTYGRKEQIALYLHII